MNIITFTFIAYADAYVQLFVYQIVIPFLPKHVEYIVQPISLNSEPVLIILLPFHDFLLRHTEKKKQI